jgi:hypothetical protein
MSVETVNASLHTSPEPFTFRSMNFNRELVSYQKIRKSLFTVLVHIVQLRLLDYLSWQDLPQSSSTSLMKGHWT